MKKEIVWQERFNIGVDSLDKAHRKLFSIMGKMVALSEDRAKQKHACMETIKYFKSYAIKHFKDEENYMESIDYSGYAMHKRLHDNFRMKTLPLLEQELAETDFSPKSIRHFLGVCIGWLSGHILTEDRAITGKAISKWQNIRSEDELSALEQTIIQILREVFRLESQVISENYGGEDFGKSIYHRLDYRSRTGEKYQVLLVYEEPLLIGTVGQMLGIKFKKVDKVVVDAARFQSQQLLERLREYFPSVDLCELEKDGLLTEEQFGKTIQRDVPPYSLLFDTGMGYLAFCVRGNISHHVADTSEALNGSPQLMNEFKLQAEKNANMKKVLVVDDSMVVRQSIKELLKEDYHVILADSGFAAIKSITLGKPDLILLDYEMPICDGRQILEMIRSNKEIADIPVIFLTGRGDMESVKKVMSLKPAGYMLKTMKPDDIKKNIDLFFEKRKEKK
ncbi:MAG: response regulator [Bacteroidales bacterium]|nr:response regulator [Clostridium sp.]MCM1204980.1 response regulator [Bacteroidales bacterium]